MKRIATGAALGMLAWSCAIAQTTITSNAMPGVAFSKFHTYKWVPIEGASHPNQIVDQEIKASVNSELSAKGMTVTDSDQADMYIGYQVSVNQEKQWNAMGMGMRFRRRDGDCHKLYHQHWNYCRGYVRPRDEATGLDRQSDQKH